MGSRTVYTHARTEWSDGVSVGAEFESMARQCDESSLDARHRLGFLTAALRGVACGSRRQLLAALELSSDPGLAKTGSSRRRGRRSPPWRRAHQ
jgi:hypothetical protein